MNYTLESNEDYRRALEALRSGVPNRDAVRALGSSQTAAIDRFRQQLSAVDSEADEDRQAKGMLVAGDFGSGKSHLLRSLADLALTENFVCSHIVIGKETPLYDPAKVYAAAIEAAVVPQVTGQAIQEIALKLDQNSPRYAEFFRWADQADGDVGSLFAATLLLHERLSNNPDMSEKIRGFWAGEKLSIAEVRSGMRDIRQAATYPLRAVPAKELPLQRFRFAARLIRAAGYRGWVLFIDEVERIGSYTRLQRGRSYAELARWMAGVETDQYPGLTAVATIVNDFEAAIFQQKGDNDYAVPYLQSRGTEEYRVLASRAETGMRIIRREALSLIPPDRDALTRTYQIIKRLHGEAYHWTPPDVPFPEQTLRRSMRSYVRRWINEWDLRYLYPGENTDTVETDVRINYIDDPDLEQSSGDSSPDSEEAG